MATNALFVALVIALPLSADKNEKQEVWRVVRLRGKSTLGTKKVHTLPFVQERSSVTEQIWGLMIQREPYGQKISP